MGFFKSAGATPEVKVVERAETKYNEILVIQHGRLREMWFVRGNEFFLQSRIDVDRPDAPVLVYAKMMMASLFFNPEPRRLLMIGLGGAVLPNFMRTWFPRTEMDIVEIDPRVIAIARKHFFFKESPACRVHEMDGREFLRRGASAGENPYDLVFIDAFKSGSVPYHLKTQEYYAEIRARMTPDGVIASNLYGKSSDGLKPRDLKTFSAVFGRAYLFEDAEDVATVLVAAERERPLDAGDMQQAALAWKHKMPLSLTEVAGCYRPGKFAEEEAEAFRDDFAAGDFSRRAEENNLNRNVRRPYPIKSVSASK